MKLMEGREGTRLVVGVAPSPGKLKSNGEFDRGVIPPISAVGSTAVGSGERRR